MEERACFAAASLMASKPIFSMSRFGCKSIKLVYCLKSDRTDLFAPALAGETGTSGVVVQPVFEADLSK